MLFPPQSAQVSSKRFQDMVPRVILLHLLRRFGAKLEFHILEALDQVHTSGSAAHSEAGDGAGAGEVVDVLDLMTENPAAQKRREAAQARVNSLAAARKVLSGL